MKENEDILHTMSAALMKYETIDKDQIDDLMARRPVRDPQGWDDMEPPNQGVKAEVPESKDPETPIIDYR